MSTLHIIIVNYNAGDWLTRCLASLLQYTDALITIVDNDSTDQSVANAQSSFTNDSRLVWQLNKTNVGFAAANNQVLVNLKQDFALLINPDCEVNQDTIPILLTAFKNNPDLGLASSCIYNEDGSVQSTCRRRFPTPWTALVRLFQLHKLFPNNPKFSNFDYGEIVFSEQNKKDQVETVEAISGAFMMVRKTALDEIGLLDEGYFMHCEDLDWCKRFEGSGWRVGFVRSSSVIHAKGISSQSRPIKVLWTLHKGMNRFFNKHYLKQYSFLIRFVVKAGIIFSFIIRSLFSLIKR